MPFPAWSVHGALSFRIMLVRGDVLLFEGPVMFIMVENYSWCVWVCSLYWCLHSFSDLLHIPPPWGWPNWFNCVCGVVRSNEFRGVDLDCAISYHSVIMLLFSVYWKQYVWKLEQKFQRSISEEMMWGTNRGKLKLISWPQYLVEYRESCWIKNPKAFFSYAQITWNIMILYKGLVTRPIYCQQKLIMQLKSGLWK